MKTVRGHPGHYRNESVFRSAERLIASRPAGNSAPNPRWWLFTAGVGLGLVLALAVVLRVERAPVRIGPAVVTTRLAEEPSRTEKTPPAPRATPLVTPAPLAPEAATTAPARSVAAENPPVPAAEAAPDPIQRSAPYVAEAKRSLAANKEAAYVSALFATLSDVTFRGELRAGKQEPRVVELQLRRFGDASEISGRIDYFEQGARIASRTVQGALVERTLSLREVAPYGTATRDVPFGYRFAFTLPHRNATLTDVSGNWALGTRSGEATLRPILPW